MIEYEYQEDHMGVNPKMLWTARQNIFRRLQAHKYQSIQAPDLKMNLQEYKVWARAQKHKAELQVSDRKKSKARALYTELTIEAVDAQSEPVSIVFCISEKFSQEAFRQSNAENQKVWAVTLAGATPKVRSASPNLTVYTLSVLMLDARCNVLARLHRVATAEEIQKYKLKASDLAIIKRKDAALAWMPPLPKGTIICVEDVLVCFKVVK